MKERNPWDTVRYLVHDISGIEDEKHPYNKPEMWLYKLRGMCFYPDQKIHGTVSSDTSKTNVFKDIDEIPSIWKQLWYNTRINIGMTFISWAFSILPACDFKFKLSKSITNILSNDTSTNT